VRPNINARRGAGRIKATHSITSRVIRSDAEAEARLHLRHAMQDVMQFTEQGWTGSIK